MEYRFCSGIRHNFLNTLYYSEIALFCSDKNVPPTLNNLNIEYLQYLEFDGKKIKNRTFIIDTRSKNSTIMMGSKSKNLTTPLLELFPSEKVDVK